MRPPPRAVCWREATALARAGASASRVAALGWGQSGVVVENLGGGWWLAAQGRWDEATAEGYVLEGGSGVGPNGRVPASRGEAE